MNRISIDLLNTFVEVSRIGNLSRAAEALQTDQSTVSRKIAKLEEEVGVALFERIGRSIRLTQAGRRFVGRAERVISETRDAVAEAAGTVSAETGEVHVGFLHTVGARWLPERLASFLQRYPGVRFVLEEGNADEVVAGVLSGGFDLGILGPPPANAPELKVAPLFRERVAVVVPAGHRLVGRSSVTLRELAEEPLILPRSRTGLRRVIDEAFNRQGLSERVAYEGDDFTIVQGMVEAGLGITLLPMPLPTPSSRVAVVPLRDPIARTMALCWDGRRTLPPAAELFLRQLTADVSEDLRETSHQ